MGFKEVKRYHVCCDKHGCENLFHTIDLTDDDAEEDSYPWELEYPAYAAPLIAILIDSGWAFSHGKLYCPPCASYVMNKEEESLFAFLKADMGIT